MSETQISYGQFVLDHFNRSGDFSKDFTHAILGFVTEIHEYLSSYDEINGLEELGDMRFYVVALQQVVKDYWLANGNDGVRPATHLAALIEMQANLEKEALVTSFSGVISKHTNDLLDHAKRWVGYAKMPKSLREVVDLVVCMELFVNEFGPYPEPDFERLQTTNMAKLLKRHGKVYNPVAADQRDTDAERAAIAAA
jgi:hypothetical protein